MREVAVRRLQVAFLAITIFSIAQVVWWIYDQSRYSRQQLDHRMALYEKEVAGARAMLSAGIEPAEVVRSLPDVEIHAVDAGYEVVVRPEAVEQLLEERRDHLNQYHWEGGFFLVVLLAAIGIVWRALRRDFELRRWQDNFLAAVSHELKSPLASLQLAAETLALRDLPAERRSRVVGRILADAKRLGVTVSNVLDTHRLDRGETLHRPEPLDLPASVRQAVEDVDFRASEAGVEFQISVPEGARVRADPQSVRSVLRNLLDNALKAHVVRQELDAPASGDSGERWSAEGSSIWIDGNVGERTVSLEVRDEGIGFPPEEAERIFAKFYRLGNELRRTAAGSGLGLHLARGLVELDGGTLRAHSDGAGRGATFSVVWPRGEPLGDDVHES
ncbi:MAG: HAMP domain-containing histidine kinase [Thermoanaerobaculia bacterium]|nr:HAMP domain-containing histidine kinase [Thermoanaerobaculia bacterium]